MSWFSDEYEAGLRERGIQAQERIAELLASAINPEAQEAAMKERAAADLRQMEERAEWRSFMEEHSALSGRTAAALERIAGALAGEAPLIDDALRDAIRRDWESGLSLRKCAEKHGVGVGVVRGLAARSLQDGESGE